jgi:hypothetical protein
MTLLQKNFDIEKIQNEINEFGKELDQLKSETDQSAKEQKTQVIQNNIISTKIKINDKLKDLKNLGEDWHQQEIEKLEEMLASLDGFDSEISELKKLVVQQKNNSTDDLENTDDPQDQAKKNIEGKTWTDDKKDIEKAPSRLTRQRNWVTDKKEWKENTATNIARVAWWIWAVSLAVRWFKKLFGIGKEKKEDKEEKKSDNKKSWRKKALLWGGWILGWVAIWKNWDWILDKLWLSNKMSFEDSLTAVKWDLNDISEWKLKARLKDLTYDESSKEIKSYWESTKIDKTKKKIEWLDSKFSDYKQLIFVANFINYIKSEFKWKWANASPFFSWTNTWDLYIKQWAHVVWKAKDVEVISGGIWSTLSTYAPDIDPGVLKRIAGITWLVDTNGKSKLVSYLNWLNIWSKVNASTDYNDQFPDNPINQTAKEVQLAIQKMRQEELDHQADRLEIEAHKISDQEYMIKSWSFETKIITSPQFKIDWMNNLSFPNVTECIRVANFLNKMKNNNHGLCENSSPFSFEREYSKRWLFVNRKAEWSITDPTHWRKILVLKEETLKSKYPTIYHKNNRQIFLNFLNNLAPEWEFKWRSSQ